MTDPLFTKNITDDREPTCGVCQDDGWVILNGTTYRHGYSYSRGSAPCKWCEQGEAAYVAIRKHRVKPESNYTIDDVDGYDPKVEWIPKREARRLIRELIAGEHQVPPEEQDFETRRLVKAQLEAKARNYAPKPSPNDNDPED